MRIVDDGRVGDWLQTYTGKRFYLLDPRPEDVDILDIAVSLGNISRYSGNCPFYSVAEHSVLVSYMVAPENALAGLMHDATEPYICDLTRPTKIALGESNAYFAIERAVWHLAIAPAFGLPLVLPHDVKLADSQILLAEKAALHPRSQEWHLPYEYPHVFILCLEPLDATESFIRRFCELTGQDVDALLARWHRMRDEDAHALENQCF